MKKAIKKLWTGALTSGEYKQNFGCLHSDKGHCVLGVLADLYRKSKNGRWTKRWHAFLIENHYTYLGQEYSLPYDVMQWAGLETPNAEYASKTSKGKKVKTSLIENNDQSNKSFKQLAKIIDKHF